VPYGSTGAGGTKASLPASYTLGFHVPDVSNEPSGSAEAAASSNVRLRPVTLPPPPASESSSIFFPSGPTSSTSTSSVKAWLSPLRLAVTFTTGPVSPETLIDDGYGVPLPLVGMLMAAVLVKVWVEPVYTTRYDPNWGRFVSQVGNALQAAELRPSQLTLEVTESVLMNGIENAVTTLTGLRQMGVTLSIDDFGTGYSSLSYLATLPIDALKIDRSFIDRMSRDGEGSEIVKAIFKLGQALSKQVYAEGIETSAQLALLQELGCEFGQGFLLSRPVGAESAGTFVASNDGVSAAA